MTIVEPQPSARRKSSRTSGPDPDSLGQDPKAVVDALRSTFASDRTRPLTWRRAQLEGLLRMLTMHEAELADALNADLGRSPIGTFMGDLAPVRAEIRHTLAALDTWAARRKVTLPLTQKPGKAWIQPQPRGVVLVIGAWNFPLLLTLQPLVSALAAGNAVAIKPSELSPHTASLLERLIPQFVDPTAVAVVNGDATVSAALLDQQWDHVFFTGSTRVGKIVARACAEHLTPVTLELGGKSPVIVAADADLTVAAKRIAWAKNVNAGQACIAPDYVLVEESVRPALVERLLEELPKAGEAEPSHIVNSDHFERLVRLLDGHGGYRTGGDLRADRLQMTPALITDPEPDSPVMQEEIFGPVLPLISVASVREAVDFVNARPRPLALYLFTSDDKVVEDVVQRTTSGSVGVNHLMYQLLVPELPFGGVGPSGLGAYHGQHGFDTFSHLKAVLSKLTNPDPSFAYPPYGRAATALLRRVMG